MNIRLIALASAAAAAVIIASCSSGLGNNLPSIQRDSPNAPVGLDLGVELADPAADAVVAGAVIPAIGAFDQRDVVLAVFTTADIGGDGSATGGFVSRDPVTDDNDVADVFVAAVSAQDIDDNAFSQSLAGKFRHPRCVTCHSMQSATSTAFGGPTTPPGFTPHAGRPPGEDFPINNPEACVQCHNNTANTSAPVAGWQAPAASFDLRTESVAALNARAQIPPTGDLEHFKGDPRVLWALNSGVLPIFGGRNGVADDDHDGVLEPSDTDGVIRTVPGGATTFVAQIDAWQRAGFPATAAGAVRDVTLVSRAVGGASAGNGASTRPQVVYVANEGYVAGSPGTVGTLFVVFESDAADLVAADTNGAKDVFRSAVDLRVDADGEIDLWTRSDVTLVSAADGTLDVGNSHSERPVIGGAAGELVAFQSQADDLVVGFTDSNGAAGYDVYVRNVVSNETVLVSHQDSNQATGGDGSSEAPAISANGAGVAFESDAVNLVPADTNGRRDVFYTDISSGAPFFKTRASVSLTGAEGFGGDSTEASVHATDSGRALVAFTSTKTDLAPGLNAASNVYLFDSGSGKATLLNQLLTNSREQLGDGDASHPVIDASGAHVAFQSAATNIDVLRADGNGHTDVFLVGVEDALAGAVLPRRYSLTTVEATDANGDSAEPQFGVFASATASFPVGFSVFRTAATNLGNSDSTDLIVTFLAETTGVVADFSVDVTLAAAPMTVQFADLSTGTPTAWEWDFDDDGNVDSTEQNPQFTYAATGVYTVRLTVTSASSSASVTRSDLITVVGAPAADFTADVTSGAAPLAVQFTDQSVDAPTSWAWDFDNDGNIDSAEQNPQFTYAAPGTYTVSLTAANVAGSASETKTDLVQVFEPVVAGFSATPTSGTAPFVVTFTNSSTGATSYVWDFGDGSATVAATNAAHTYSSSGSFTATLTASGPGGVSTATTGITSNGAVSASFTITIGGAAATAGYGAQTVTLDASDSLNAATYAWDLDDNGTTDHTGETVEGLISDLFPTIDETSYTIKLTATGPGGSGSTTLAFTSVADSEIYEEPATDDTTIFSNTVNANNGANSALVIGKTWQAGYRRAVLRFDVSTIPAGATINTATVRFRDISPAGLAGAWGPPNSSQLTGAQTFQFHRLTTAWIEGGANGWSGVGTASNANGGATFASPWTTSGGDFLGPSATVFVDNSPGDFVTSNSVVADVQDWVNGAANNGWLLRSTLETGLNTQASIKWFASSEAATESHRPTLSINFTRPLP